MTPTRGSYIKMGLSSWLHLPRGQNMQELPFAHERETEKIMIMAPFFMPRAYNVTTEPPDIIIYSEKDECTGHPHTNCDASSMVILTRASIYRDMMYMRLIKKVEEIQVGKTIDNY